MSSDQSLLLAMLLFARQDFSDLLSGLPDARANLLKEQGNQLLAMDRDKRVPMMIGMLKKLLAWDAQPSILFVEPSWIAQALEQESPLVACIVAKKIPPTLWSRVEPLLSPTLHNSLNASEPVNVKEEVATEVFRIFDSQFMDAPFDGGVVSRTSEELLKMAVELGRTRLAELLSGIGIHDSAIWLEHFEKSYQDDLIAAVKDVKTTAKIDPKEAQKFLDQLLSDGTMKSLKIEELLKRIGLLALAETLPREPRRQIQLLAQRMPYADGKWLLEKSKKTS